MNFCKFYNRAMNKIQEIWNWVADDNEEKRENVKEINIIVGIIDIIIYLTIVMIIGTIIIIVGTAGGILYWIYEHTKTKCESSE